VKEIPNPKFQTQLKGRKSPSSDIILVNSRPGSLAYGSRIPLGRRKISSREGSGSPLTGPEFLLDSTQPAIGIPGGLAMIDGLPYSAGSPPPDKGLAAEETALANFSLAGAVRFCGEGKALPEAGHVTEPENHHRRDGEDLGPMTAEMGEQLPLHFNQANTMPHSGCAAKT
jgi:hypothetical protein